LAPLYIIGRHRPAKFTAKLRPAADPETGDALDEDLPLRSCTAAEVVKQVARVTSVPHYTLDSITDDKIKTTRLVALSALMAVVSGCESDEKKLARLDSEKLTQCLLAQAAQSAFESAGNLGPSNRMEEIAARNRGDTATAERLSQQRFAEMKKRGLDTLAANVVEQKRKCDLAQRDYDLFMSGR
jgi:hypothetical protein